MGEDGTEVGSSCGGAAVIGAYLIEAYFQQRDLFALLHEKETQMGEIIEQASQAFEREHGHPPLTQAEKKQALLDQILRENVCDTND